MRAKNYPTEVEEAIVKVHPFLGDLLDPLFSRIDHSLVMISIIVLVRLKVSGFENILTAVFCYEH